MRILILYHNACADGSFAAATVSLAFPMDVIHYIALDYAGAGKDTLLADGTPLHEHPEIFSYDRVYFVDFAPPESQLAKFTAHYKNNLYVFDHHDTANPELYRKECEAIAIPDAKPSEPQTVQPSTNVTFASQSSGAMLSYFGVISQFQPSNPRTMSMIGNLMRIVQLVSDRDTWRKENKRAFAFYDGYAKEMFANKEDTGVLYKETPSTVSNARNIVLKGNVEEIIKLGFDRIVERNATIEKMFAANGRIFEANDIVECPHAVISTSRAIGSDTADWIQENHPVGLVLVVRVDPTGEKPDDVYCSVRSGKTNPVRAKTIAEKFGGTGHPNAAGCVIPRKTFETFYSSVNPDYRQIQI